MFWHQCRRGAAGALGRRAHAGALAVRGAASAAQAAPAAPTHALAGSLPPLAAVAALLAAAVAACRSPSADNAPVAPTPPPAAGPTYEWAAASDAVPSNEHTAKWRIYTDAAREHLRSGRPADAKRYLDHALLESRSGFGDTDAHVAAARHNLGDWHRLSAADAPDFSAMRAEFDAAEAHLVAAVDLLHAGRSGPEYTTALGPACHDLGLLRRERRDFAAAADALRHALRAKAVAFGSGHPESASTLAALADVLARLGRVGDGITLLKESVACLDGSGARTTGANARRLARLGEMQATARRWRESESTFRRLTDLHGGPTPALGSPGGIAASEGLAVALVGQGRRAEAVSVLSAAFEAAAAAAGETHPVVGRLRRLRATAAMAAFDAPRHRWWGRPLPPPHASEAVAIDDDVAACLASSAVGWAKATGVITPARPAVDKTAPVTVAKSAWLPWVSQPTPPHAPVTPPPMPGAPARAARALASAAAERSASLVAASRWQSALDRLGIRLPGPTSVHESTTPEALLAQALAVVTTAEQRLTAAPAIACGAAATIQRATAEVWGAIAAARGAGGDATGARDAGRRAAAAATSAVELESRRL